VINPVKIFNVLKEVAIATDKVAGAKIAAAVVYKNKIISVGVNSTKSSPLQKRYSRNRESIYLHAEIAAIKNALRHVEVDNLKNCYLFICRVKNSNNKMVFGLSKPCEGCTRAIVEFNFKKVYFTIENGYHIM